ncbi:GNAT family N-acetyltransferase [Aquimarina mytili]|uniref:GNAT family N-acetyltransferase n=1 Tax=Aquimarina mytili TaxID=874423 RepID=A0A936ZYR8_9FLAO|nr:GNAT family N-acetyltransferase [Aquimarina mytili]MBL0684428.1 GNAT family N-acetyltransferase [Aquimarina mytili]
MLISSPVIETKRLTLRSLEETDSEAIRFLRSDQTVNQFVKRPKTDTLEDAIHFITKIKNGVHKGDWIFWGITIKDNPVLIGTICLWNFSEDRKIAEIGYDLHPKHQGNGIMSEAIQSILDYGFGKLALERIEAYTHKNNEPSKRLLQKFHFDHIHERIDTDNEDNIIFTIHKRQHCNT